MQGWVTRAHDSGKLLCWVTGAALASALGLVGCSESETDPQAGGGTAGSAAAGGSSGGGTSSGGTAAASGAAAGGSGGAVGGGAGAGVTGGASGASAGAAGEPVGGVGGAAGAEPPPCAPDLGPLEECRGQQRAPRGVSMPIGFRIDATEVTRAQYAAWLASEPSPSAQDPACSGNDSFAPGETCLADPRVCSGTDCDRHPQVCVDWCDAMAFCQAGGRHLCANPEGGSVPFDRYADTFLDQFYYVCSADAKQDYVYGIAYDSQACNVNERTGTGCLADCVTVEVGSLEQCQGLQAPAFPGAYDLIGNVAEWEDCCESDAVTALCRARGGDMAATEQTGACDGSITLARDEVSPTVGFRCCSD